MAIVLDGAGQAKMSTLEEAILFLQRLHGLVERFAIAVRSGQETGSFRMQLQRTATPLAGMLKPQFGMIADQVMGFILITTRASADQSKLRGMREAVAQIRMQLEIAVTKVKEHHAVPSDDEPKGAD